MTYTESLDKENIELRKTIKKLKADVKREQAFASRQLDFALHLLESIVVITKENEEMKAKLKD